MKKAIELNPEDVLVLNYLGYTWAEMGVQLDEAEDLIARALKIAPNDGFYIDSLGWVYYQKGDYPRAVEQLERAVELDGGRPDDHRASGRHADQKAGRVDGAVVRYRESLKHSKEAEQTKRVREKSSGWRKRFDRPAAPRRLRFPAILALIVTGCATTAKPPASPMRGLRRSKS